MSFGAFGKQDSEEINFGHEATELNFQLNSENLFNETENKMKFPEFILKKRKSTVSIIHEIPDKFAGWGLTSVIGCFLFCFNTWGANSAYALYYELYLNDNVFPDATKMDYGIIGGLTFGCGFTFGPLINYSVNKLGMKVTIFSGILLQFSGVLMASFATRLWELYCTQGILQGIGLALIYVPSVNIIPQWFKGRAGGKRNLALGIGAAGSGVGGIIYNICLEPLVAKRGYQWSMRAQAIICISLNMIAICLIKSRDKHIKPVYKVYDNKVWSCFGTQCLFIWEMFTLFGYVTILYNLGDFTRSLGYSSNKGSLVSTCVSIGVIYGRPAVGKIGDIVGPINVTILASWLVAFFALAMWIPCGNFATAVVFALFEGSLMGTIWVTLATLNVSVVGLRKLGIGLSVSWIAAGIFGFVSPIISIALKKDGPESPLQYQPVSIFVGLCYFMAGIILLILRGWILARNNNCVNIDDENEMLNTNVSANEVLSNTFSLNFSKI